MSPRIKRRCRRSIFGLWEGVLEFAKLYLILFGVLTVAGGVMGFVR